VLFGLAPRFRLDLRDLEQRYRELQRALHPDRHSHAPAAARRMNLGKAVEVNEAYRVLRDDIQRAEALLARFRAALLDKPVHEGMAGSAGGEARIQEGEGKQVADPAFLMEIMELREALSDARRARDLARVSQLAQTVAASREQTRARLADVLDKLAEERTGSADDARTRQLDEGQAQLSRLKYYQRFLDEVAIVEEEASG
jgi:molecular chaperone HscB